MKFKIAGIKRMAEYSPNHVENDSRLFSNTADELKNLGAEVTVYLEKEINENIIKEEIIFTMARSLKANKILTRLCDKGKFIINNPQSVLNCYRMNMINILTQNKIPFPKSFIINVDEPERISFNDIGTKKIWIKRGDVHAIHREDVTLCYNEEEKNFILMEFARRGIRQAILQAHLEGDVIKFYSIRNSELFYWYYLNGDNHTGFEENKLKDLAQRSSEVLGLEIYGGDAVILKDGSIVFIDINDFPSFAPIRNWASKEIAGLIYRTSIERLKDLHT